MTIERDKIERVIGVFAEYIDNADEIDVALSRKNGYVILIDNSFEAEIYTGRDMCKALLHEMDIDFRTRFDLDRNEIPAHLRPVLYKWMLNYMKWLPEYQDLLKDYC